MAKKKTRQNGIVYSTDPGWIHQSDQEEQPESPEPSAQQIRISIDKKNRAGKIVTLVAGFNESDEAVDALGKELKKYCGTGGSVSEGEILIQGDCRKKVLDFLIKKGYSKTKII